MRADPQLTWYALISAPQQELRLRADLKDCADVIVPMESIWRQATSHSRQLELVKQPMFPGYVFLGGSIPYGAMRKSKAYRDIVALDGTPSKVDPSQINAALDVAASQVTPERPGFLAFKVGMTVKFATGALAGKHGVVTDATKDKVKVLREFLGSTREITVNRRELETLSQ